MAGYSQRILISIVLIILTAQIDVYAKQSAPWVGVGFDQMPCKEWWHADYGPYDYTNADHRKNNLHVVEDYHFTPQVQMLMKSMTGDIANDIAYTLGAFPNHYKALESISNYQILHQTDIEKKAIPNPKAECFYQRAIHFKPKDATLYVLYAIFLKRVNKFAEADKFYKVAIEIEPERLKFRYVYGLFLVNQKKYDLAKKQAEYIYPKGFLEDKLKKKLIEAGYW